MLTEEQKLIATLPSDPSYRALICHLESENAEILKDLAVEADPAKILYITRFWQTSTRILGRLKLVPETIAELIANEKERINGATIASEFLGQDEDTFLHNVRTVPPPYQDTL